MAKDIDNALLRLVEALKDTDEYREYMRAKAKITPADMENIRSYKNLRASLMMSPSEENENRAKEICKNLMLDLDTRNYMLCEKKILSMVAGIYDEIGSGLKII